ncbi:MULTISPECIES: MBL fold metallo-hydrolase [Paenibacillus]|uniref:MBL fold metallo-hydrolase n=1 Tax=Paenibacillus campinasensis TaxID=66347 RepID=A0ABW9T1I6_9BACL|nr:MULTISPECIES: MBL fold metallo-hydrolase [Paenibacillus]MUG66005.1 MBL fold metallo-hydrolase [Paenibacillus campinasensis]PAK49770.1 MBL fold metallo-hydrolase [Paenibacillus sp. 7541]
MSADQLTFLGTGDAMGVPRVYCDCAVCAEARDTGMNRRLRSSVMIESGADFFLVDCGPDWRVMMEHIGQRTVRHILVTHPHFDHIGGLPEWADACRWLGEKGNLYAPQEVLSKIVEQYPWLPGNLEMTAVDHGVQLCGWHIICWRVNHGKNGYSYAYRLEKNGFVWAYNSDSIDLNAEEKAHLRGLDLLVLGTSFVHEKAAFATRSVYDMREAADLLAELKPRQTIYTHMSHDVDVRRDLPLPEGVRLACTGMKVRLAQES